MRFMGWIRYTEDFFGENKISRSNTVKFRSYFSWKKENKTAGAKKGLFLPTVLHLTVLQSKPAAIIQKLLNNMRTIKQLAHWARGGTWSPCCLSQSISVSVMVRNQMLILLHMFMWWGNMPFLSFLAGKKPSKTTWENNSFMGKVWTYKYTLYLEGELWFLSDWIKAPLDYYRIKPRSWENSRVSNWQGSESCNSGVLQDLDTKGY